MGQDVINPPAHERPTGCLYLSAQQDDVANITWTIVDLNTIWPDHDDAIEDVATHRITPGPAGFYLLIAQAGFTNIVPDKKYQVAVNRNGAGNVAFSNKHSSHNDNIYPLCMKVVYLDAGDWIDMRVYHNAGVGTVDIVGGADTFLSAQRVR